MLCTLALAELRIPLQPGVSECALQGELPAPPHREVQVAAATPVTPKKEGRASSGKRRRRRSLEQAEDGKTSQDGVTPKSVSAKAKREQEQKMEKLKSIAARLNQVMEEVRVPTGPSLKAAMMTVPAPPVVMGDEYIMIPKGHGTSSTPVQRELRWHCDPQLADEICNFNRHAAEDEGYFETTTFLQEEKPEEGEEVTFYDSNTGKALFYAPRGRSFQDFVKESKKHGWPSFRENEVNWKIVRVLPDGEVVSLYGAHLGHNLPDVTGNRFCINLVSIAGKHVPPAMLGRK